jgi:hypothetical protein
MSWRISLLACVDGEAPSAIVDPERQAATRVKQYEAMGRYTKRTLLVAAAHDTPMTSGGETRRNQAETRW